MGQLPTGILGLIINPIGYLAEHVSSEQAAREYASSHSPSGGINLDSITQTGFITDRQHWIDGCTEGVKSRDSLYTRSKVAGNCAAQFDQNSITQDVNNALQKRAIDEQAANKATVAQNTKYILYLIAAFLFVGLILYLFLS